jgi:hypothetical protein
MTNKDQKSQIRRRMAESGVSWAEARRQLAAERRARSSANFKSTALSPDLASRADSALTAPFGSTVGQVLAPMLEARQAMIGQALAPMLEARQAMIGQALAPMLEARQAMIGQALAPMLEARQAMVRQALAPVAHINVATSKDGELHS